MKLVVVDASERFMHELKGVTDPEAKRKIIGRLFVEVFQEEAAKLPNAKWLAQGTIYPDVISKALPLIQRKAKTIKSHHNVGDYLKHFTSNSWNHFVNSSRMKSESLDVN